MYSSDRFDVGRAPLVPDELTSRPFTVDEAKRAGISLTALRGKAWTRLATKLYCWSGLDPDPWLTLTAWSKVLSPDAVFTGATAAWMHGLDFPPLAPLEVIVPPTSGMRSRTGLKVRRAQVGPDDVALIRSLRATSLTRTLVELCAHRTDVEALVAVDMALRHGRMDVETLMRFARSTKSAGTARLRRIASLGAPAESPMETRLRWLFVRNGLPHPEVQADLHNSRGQIIGRADLFYRSHRLVIEFDGANHKERLVSDDRRQNSIISAGYRILRFTTADLRDEPESIVAQVRATLNEAPVWRQTGGNSRPMHLFGAEKV